MKNLKDIFKILWILFAITILAISSSCSNSTSDSTRGDVLMEEAQRMEEIAYYHAAYEKYKSAYKAYLNENNSEMASCCRQKYFDLNKTFLCYPIAHDQLFEKMQQYNPQYTQEDLTLWLSEGWLDYMMMDGAPWYLEGCFTNLSYSHPDVLARDENLQKNINYLSSRMLEYVNNHPDTGEIYLNPHRFEASQKLAIPRDKLPAQGTLKIWLPFPIELPEQKDIEMVSISPAEYWKEGPNTGSDIGCVYFETPLAELTGDLNIEVRFRFTRYEERFDIDPKKVGEYDTNSELYKKYTRSNKNLAVTDEIIEKAREIVGNETNPHRKARLIYDYVVDNIKYGLSPNISEEALGEPVSVFVQREGYGDCAGHALYFAALCRAAGIPARATGGYELWVPNGSGHFWAEYYLPNYGWVPLDTSLAVATSLSTVTTEGEKELLRNYMFASLDPYRLIFQNDTDTCYTPLPSEKPFTTFCFQSPMAECPEMEEDPTVTVQEYFKWHLESSGI